MGQCTLMNMLKHVKMPDCSMTWIWKWLLSGQLTAYQWPHLAHGLQVDSHWAKKCVMSMTGPHKYSNTSLCVCVCMNEWMKSVCMCVTEREMEKSESAMCVETARLLLGCTSLSEGNEIWMTAQQQSINPPWSQDRVIRALQLTHSYSSDVALFQTVLCAVRYPRVDTSI